MNWDAIGAMGEIVGAMAVVATLFYLAIQIRFSMIQDKKRAIEATYLSYNDIRKSLFENEDLACIFTTGLDSPEKLTDIETFRYMSVCETLFHNAESFLKQLGDLKDERVDIILDFCSFYLQTPGGQAFWKHPQSYNLTESFRKLIESRTPTNQDRLLVNK